MPTIKTLKQNNEQVAPRTVIDAIVDYDIDEFDDLSTLVNGATYSERIQNIDEVRQEIGQILYDAGLDVIDKTFKEYIGLLGGTASTATSLSELLNEFKTILDDSSITYSNLADVIYTKFNPIYQVYTVRIDTTNSDPETALTYLDDAVGMTPGYDGWKDTKIIKNIKPCVLNNGEVQYYLQKDNYTLKEDGTTSVLDGTDGDVMVEIPKIGYRLWKDSNYQYISITDDPDKEGYCYYAHSLNSAGDCSKLYIGAYLSNMNGRSYSGQTPGYSLDLNENRDLAIAIGSNYSLFSFYSLTLLQCLYVIIYKNLNSQAVLGQGYTEARLRSNTGGTNSNTFCFGSTSGSQQVKFLGIEDFYGNEFYWVDGLYYDSNRNIKTDYRNSVFTGGDGDNFQFSISSGLTSNISEYMTQIQGTNETGFIPRVASGGNMSIYYCDYNDLYADHSGYFGGTWGDSTMAGAFQLSVKYSASYTDSYLGARLQYKQLAN